MIFWNIRYLSLVYLLLFSGKIALPQGLHVVSVSYTPALSAVNVNNFTDFSINSFSKELYSRQNPDMPAYGYVLGFNYSYRFNEHWSLGAGLSISKKQSDSGLFYLYETSKSKTIYNHTYQSIEIPLRIGYIFNNKSIAPVIVLESGLDLFKKFKMSVYSINNQTNKKNNFLNETHYGIKWSLARISGGVLAGVRIKIFRFLSVSALPEFRYYSNAFRITKCPDCASFIEGNMWLMGLRTELSLDF